MIQLDVEPERTLTPEEINQVLNFADYFEGFSQGYNDPKVMFNRSYASIWGLQNRYYTPDMVNQAIQDINMNPQVPTADAIKTALAQPKDSEMILRDYATYFEIHNQFYKRLIQFNADLMAWNPTFDCINLEKDSEINSAEFKKDLKVVDKVCSSLNFKRDFRIIVSQILRQGVYFGVLRDETDLPVWQELPPNFCKITGNSNVGYLFSFDFSYFLNYAGGNIDMFPKVFKKLFREIQTQIATEYNPKGNIDKRHSSFVYWIDVSPKDNFFCFTLDDGLATLIPFYSGLFADLDMQPVMRALEKDKAMIAAQKLLVGIIDTLENVKSGAVANQFKINPKDIGKFLSLVRQSLDKSIGVATLPVKDVQVVDFNVEAQNRYKNYMSNIAANALASSAPMMSENKLNSFEAQLALTIDQNFVRSLYGQFAAFLSYYVNQRTSKYKFKFSFHDTNDMLDRNKRLETFSKLASMGIVDFSLYARINDQNIFEAKRALKISNAMGFEKELVPLLSLNNQSPSKGVGSGTVGRPKASPLTTNDSTAATQEFEQGG